MTADGAVATELSGRTVGDATTLTVTTDGRAVEYIRIPPTAWAREPGGTWVVIDAAQAPSSPLAALAKPTTLTPVGSDGATMEATYPAAAFGLQGDPVTVSIQIAGATVTFTYRQNTKGHAVVSTTMIRPATDPAPITAPTG